MLMHRCLDMLTASMRQGNEAVAREQTLIGKGDAELTRLQAAVEAMETPSVAAKAGEDGEFAGAVVGSDGENAAARSAEEYDSAGHRAD